MAVKIKVIDKKSRFQKLKFELEKALTIEVGILDPKASEAHPGGSGLTFAEVSALHEFGLGVPQRPWLRGWYDLRKASFAKRITNTVGKAYLGGKGQRLRVTAEKLGKSMVRDLRSAMLAVPPPLAASTVKKKGHDRTLVDSWALRSAVDFKATIRKGPRGLGV